MKFEWITDWETIWSDAFVEQWNKWLNQSENGHAFFNPGIVKAWVEAYTPIEDIKPLFCIATINDTTVFLPFVLWTRNWKNAYVKMFIPAGHGVFDYLTPLYIKGSDEITWEEYWKNLLENIHKNFKNEYDIIELLSIKKEFAAPSWAIEDVCPISDISTFTTVDEFIASRKSSFRHTIKRRLKRFHELGTVEYIVIDDTEEALSYLPKLLDLHKQLWPNAYKAPSFHKNLMIHGIKNGTLHFSILLLNNEPVSYVLSFVHQGRYCHYMSAYDSKYHKHSIGNLHILNCFEDCIQKKFHTYDLLRGDEAYKFDWTTGTEEVYGFTYTNAKLSTLFKRLLLSLKKRLK